MLDSLTQFSLIFPDKFAAQWLKQVKEHKLLEKLSDNAKLALSTHPLAWNLGDLIKDDYKNFKRELNDADSLSIFIENALLFESFPFYLKRQIKASATSGFKELLFTRILKENSNFNAATQKLPWSHLSLNTVELSVPFNQDVINSLSEKLALCTRYHSEKIGTTQTKLLLTSLSDLFLGVFTFYPALNSYFISGDRNTKLSPEVETEIKTALLNENIITEDSIQLFTEEEFKIANNIIKTSAYKNKVLESIFLQRCFNYFSPLEVEEKKAEVIALHTDPLTIKKKELLYRLSCPDECSFLIDSLKERIKETTDPTEIEFIESLLESPAEPESFFDFFKRGFYE